MAAEKKTVARPAATGWAWLDTLKRRDFLLKLAFVVVLLVWPVVFKSLFALNVMTTAGFFAILTISVGLILGQAGQLSFGHSAFYGIGAYTAAILTMTLHLSPWLGLAASPITAGLVALIIGRPVLRLKYFYLALATIGLGQIFLVLVLQVRGLTGGDHGMGPVPSLDLFGFTLDTYARKYYTIWIVVLLILFFSQRALKYRVGRAFRAIATSEIAASTLGVRNANWKLMAFVVSALYCGLAGGLFAFLTGAVAPTSFSFSAAVLPVVMMLVGGDRNVWGGVMGAIVMTWVGNGIQGVQQYSGVVFSVIMILLLMFLPAGIVGGLSESHRARLRSLFRRGRRPGPVECAVALPLEVASSPLQPETPSTVSSAAVRTATAANRADGAETADGATETPLLRVDGVSVVFGGLKAVSEVSLSVYRGQVAALIGPNGAGKTTLFNVISRLQTPTSGRVWFDGVELTKLSPADAARTGLARTFQNLRIFPNMSVLENVLVGCHRHERSGIVAGGLGLPGQRAEERTSHARAFDALTMVGLEQCAGMPAASLSYGRQRLVEIARALASEPRLLLLDEPAAGMNAEERAYLVERIVRIRDAGVTVLLVEHDIELVMGISEAVSVLDYGRLIAGGRPEEVQKDAGVIAAYLGAERARDRDLCATRDLLSAEAESMLTVDGISTSYGVIEAVRDVSLDVRRGEVVAVLGANGAGKTTLLHTISGLLRPTQGHISYQGRDITRLAPDKIAARGLCHVPEGRQLFPSLSVEENLAMGASGRKKVAAELQEDIAFVYELFPILSERRRQQAGTLSGGEQQMLAIGRALAGRPELLVLDEPSMGLAPMAVERIFEALARLNAQGLTMLMVEQNAEMALSVAHRAVVLQTGSVVLCGEATELRQDDRVRECYLGQSQA